MMPWLIIISSFLFLTLCSQTWALFLVMRNGKKIATDRDLAKAELLITAIHLAEARIEITAKNDIIMAMEKGAGLLQREHEQSVHGLHRIIGKLLLKQDPVVEDQPVEQLRIPLQVVRSG